MSVGLQVSILDTARPTLDRVRTLMRPEQINRVVGVSATRFVRAHLSAQDRTRPNALGGKRTHFYAQAARATSFTIDPDGVTISIAQVGIAQRFFGGTIKAKPGKYLTIPANPAAHGKRAREFDLELVFGAGGRPVALATKSTRRVEITQGPNGKVRKRVVGQRGEIMFTLVKSVTQAPDPTVLPSADELTTVVITELNKQFESVISRRELASARARALSTGGLN